MIGAIIYKPAFVKCCGNNIPSKKEIQFHHEMIGVYKRALYDAKYNATRFLNMVNEQGGLQAAKTLLQTDKVTDGYVALYMCGRLDITMEALVIKPEWWELFTDEEIQIATKRLKNYGYKF